MIEGSVHIRIPSTKQGTSFVPDSRSCEDQRQPFEFNGDPLPGMIDRSRGVPWSIEADSVYISGKGYELDMSSGAITKTDTLTKSLIQDAIDIATERNGTMVLESVVYRDGHAK
nr:uncharacterized protein I203_01514 [Kwoniella mangroviensis CBS 8507]OCF69650.1 hypothetical protein I203_01514 [Kwoniella mangroviensis CBS 8507]